MPHNVETREKGPSVLLVASLPLPKPNTLLVATPYCLPFVHEERSMPSRIDHWTPHQVRRMMGCHKRAWWPGYRSDMWGYHIWDHAGRSGKQAHVRWWCGRSCADIWELSVREERFGNWVYFLCFVVYPSWFALFCRLKGPSWKLYLVFFPFPIITFSANMECFFVLALPLLRPSSPCSWHCPWKSR
jgi:hypothetical protein